MAELKCEVAPGLADFTRFAIVKDLEGRRHSLQVNTDFLKVENGSSYLPVGVVYRERDRVLVEFSHEADSGTSRIWVAASELH